MQETESMSEPEPVYFFLMPLSPSSKYILMFNKQSFVILVKCLLKIQ